MTRAHLIDQISALAEQTRERAFSDGGLTGIGRSMLLADHRTLVRMAAKIAIAVDARPIDVLLTRRLFSIALRERIGTMALRSAETIDVI